MLMSILFLLLFFARANQPAPPAFKSKFDGTMFCEKDVENLKTLKTYFTRLHVWTGVAGLTPSS